MNYFTSDLHFGHENIIKYCNRPFNNADEMNSALFAMIWSVPEGSTLWVLGDVCMKSKEFADSIAVRLSQIPIKIKIIGGNHDKGRTEIYRKYGLLEHQDGRHVYEVEGVKISMGHYPIESGSVYEPATLYLNGHVHDEWTTKPFDQNLNINVGYDIWKKPITVQELCQIK